jgi:hypothetical protein
MAARPPALRLPLHAHQLVVAKPRRALVRRADHEELRRGTHRSIRQVNTDIRAWIDTWNEDPRPFVWTKTADQILDSIARYCDRINASGP